jgi:phosphoglycerol transferase MdoB-like AlkP superfamily enzyme
MKSRSDFAILIATAVFSFLIGLATAQFNAGWRALLAFLQLSTVKLLAIMLLGLSSNNVHSWQFRPSLSLPSSGKGAEREGQRERNWSP